MEFEVLGWAEDGPTLRLDYREFSYAGKFVMSSTGKAVVRDDDRILGAAAFDADRTAEDSLRIRYVTIHTDRRGQGLGTRLLRFVRERAREQGYQRVVIAVNNPYAYEAASKAGFAFTGEETGVAELVMAWPGERTANYTDGLALFAARDLTEGEQAFLDARGETPPPVVDCPA